MAKRGSIQDRWEKDSAGIGESLTRQIAEQRARQVVPNGSDNNVQDPAAVAELRETQRREGRLPPDPEAATEQALGAGGKAQAV